MLPGANDGPRRFLFSLDTRLQAVRANKAPIRDMYNQAIAAMLSLEMPDELEAARNELGAIND